MIQVNLIPAAIHITRVRRRHMKVWGTAVLAAAVLLLLPLGTHVMRRAGLKDLTAAEARLHHRIQSTRAKLKGLARRARRAQTRLDRAQALKAKRAWSGLLGVIASRMTEGCWLTSVATDPPTPTGSGPALPKRAGPAAGDSETGEEAVITLDAPRTLRIAGFATGSAEPHRFVTNLKKSGVFTRVALEKTQRQPVLDGSYFRFELVCEW